MAHEIRQAIAADLKQRERFEVRHAAPSWANEEAVAASQPQPCLFELGGGGCLELRRRGDLFAVVRAAWGSLYRPLPEDHVVSHPQVNQEFLARCRALGAGVPDRELNHALLNARKAGFMTGCARETVEQLDPETADRISHACELAGRYVQLQVAARRGAQPSIDRILCDPHLREMFDEAAQTMLPAPVIADESRQAYLMRLGLIRLRKLGSARARRRVEESPSLGSRSVDVGRFNPESVPNEPGIYEVRTDDEHLFVGSTVDLRRRLRAHWEAGGGGFIPAAWRRLTASSLRIVVMPCGQSSAKLNLDAIAISRKLRFMPTWNLHDVAA